MAGVPDYFQLISASIKQQADAVRGRAPMVSMYQRWQWDEEDGGIGDGFRVTPQCNNCAFYRRDHSLTCLAFPKGIPIAILLNEFDHRGAWPEDGGVQYVPVEPIPHPLAGKEDDPDCG